MISASRRMGLKGTASSRWNHSARISSIGHRLPLSSSLSGSITNINIRFNQIHSFNSIHNSSTTLQSRNHSTTSSISAPATAPSSTPTPSRWELYSPTSIMTKLPPPLPQDNSPLEERERRQLEKSQINLLRKSKGQEAVTRANQRRKMPSLYPRQNLSELSPINQTINYDHQFSVEPLSNSEITQLLPNSSSNSSSTSNPTNEIASNLFSPSLQSTSSLTSTPSTSTTTTTDAPSTSTPSDSSPHLPPDTFAPSPRSIEMLAVLKGSLAANLTTKSHKLFTELRRASTRRLADLEKSTSIFTDSLMINETKDDGEPNRTESELEEEGLNAITANQIVESHERGLLEVERFKRAYDSPLDLPTYNLMIGAYLLRASTSSSTVSDVSNESDAMVRFKHAWNLFQDLSKARNTRLECRQYKERKAKALRNGEDFDEVMKKNSPDPGVDASTIGTMALGLTRLLKFKSQEVEDQSHLLGRGLTFESCFNDLIHSMVINDINYEDLTKSPSLRYNFYLQEADQESKHPSIIDVLQQLQAAAVRLGNRRFEHVIAQQIEIEMEHMEDGHDAPPSIFDASSEYEDSPNSIEEGRLRSHHMEELKPVRASSKGAIKAAVDNGTLEGVSTNSNGEIESIIPFNLLNLKASLSNLTKPDTAAVDNPYERQIRLELSARDAARESLKFGATVQKELEKSTGNNPALASTQLQRWMWSWYGKLSQVLETDLKRMKKEMDLAEAEIWNRERNAKIKRRARGRQYSASKRKAAEEDQVEEEASDLVEEEEAVDNSETLKESASEWSKEGAVEAQIYPFLKLLSEDKLALITVLDAMRLQGAGTASDGIKTARAVLAIGKAVELEIVNGLMRKTGKHSDYIKQEHEKMKKNGVLDYKAREMLRNDAEKRGDSELMSLLAKFNQNLRAKIGSYLLQHFMEVATIVRKATDRDGEEWEEEQPAMYSSYQYLGGKKLGVIKLNDAIIKRLDKDSVVQTIHPRHLPMVYPPRPWLTYNHGGYLTFPGHAMRYKDSLEQEKFLAEASKEGEIEVILSGLDVLGHTPWRINEKVFSVMSDAWNRGEGLADLPPVEIPEEQPQKPDNMNTDLKARMIYYAKLKAYNLNKIANHSQRCDTNYKLEIARAYLGEKIYFPHNMDFRGRAYPIPPNLNHIGNDVCRGLLLFDESKKLGTAGLKWLRVHIANLHGFDKANFSDREQFSIDNEHLIRDSANNPSDGQRWWAKADDPWQCLSACIELTEALDHPEGPEEFESRLPVHQDGTCNGLQHYAALGGDDAGARQVNLASGDKPSDVYTGIADLVIEALKREVAEGNEMAIMLEGKVTRKVVKQTVMTTVYGVTFIGAKNQVQRQLADRGDVPVELLFDSATYLARIIMNCIGDLFSGAEEIQDWLSETAKLISRSIPPDRIRYATMKNEKQTRKKSKQEDQEAIVPKHNIPISTNHIAKSNKAGLTRLEKEQMTSVIWTTPLGLPVVQPYRKSMKKQVATSLQTVFIADPNANSEVAPQKQASAFPPNFIHSLDATHMILTALECCNAGLTFASVHDSYWTHACDIETMSDLIRETFVRLHKQDILGNLKREFEKRYEGFLVPIIARDRARDSTKAKRARGGRKMDPDFEKIIPTSDAARLQAEEEEALEMEHQEEEDDEFLEGTSDLKPSQPAVEMDTETFRARGLDKKSKAGTLVTADSSETSSENGKAKRVSTKNPEEYLQAKFVLLKDAIPEIPRKGNFKIDEIMSSPYFFS